MTRHIPAAIPFGVASSDRTPSRGWQEHAACRSCPPDLFFPIGATGHAAEEIAAAKQICATCDVRRECLDYALRTNQEFGVWGGYDEGERHRVRRRDPHVPGVVVPPATSGR